jgi:hypothetical protein
MNKGTLGWELEPAQPGSPSAVPLGGAVDLVRRKHTDRARYLPEAKHNGEGPLTK